MEITEVKVILKEGPDKKLKAYATLTFDNSFVVRNVKVIKGTKGLFVAMPSRRMREACPKCNYKNAIRSRFCNQCGIGLPPPQTSRDVHQEMRQSEHRDIAHPITLECREYIQKRVLDVYEAELKQAPAFQKSPSIEKMPRGETIAQSKEEPVKETPPPVSDKPVEDDGDIKL